MPSIFNSFRLKNRAEVGDGELQFYDLDERLQKNEATVNELPVKNTNTGSSWNLLRRSRISILKFWIRGRSPTTDGQQVSWRPTTLRTPILSCFAIVSLTIVGILEYLSYRSSRNGNGRGLAFAASTDDLSIGVSFLYMLLPTIISVCYSMLWSWVDLDAKRLEPWYQLSKPEGASAKDSLLLQYPADFLGLVPITAARRRHWAVFYTGGIMMMIIWFITPLQSAIFTTGSVIRTRNSLMWTTKSLPAIELQDGRLNASFLNTAYGISWLDEKLPAYTTKKYALAPYAPVNLSYDSLPSEIWASTTEMYSTSLSCTPADITLQSDTDYTFTSEAGCVVNEIGLEAEATANYTLYYIQYWNNAYDDWVLQSPTCGLEFQHNFLAIWANAASQNASYPNDFSNITAMFCEPSYQVQTVYAQVNASDQAVIDNEHYETIGLPRNLTEDVFNITKFEYLIGTGVASTVESTGDWPDIAVLEQFPRLNSYGLAYPVTNMVGFAVANMNYTVDELVDPSSLQKAFEGAHQVLFSSAFSTVLDPSDFFTAATRNGTRQDKPGAIIFVRTFSIIVEASLCVVSVLTFLLWLKTFARPSNMTQDPASIKDVIAIVSGSQGLLSEFTDDGHTTEEALAMRLSQRRFRLVQVQENKQSRMRLEALGGQDIAAIEISSRFSKPNANQHFRSIRPKELRLLSGFAFVLYMLAGLIVIVYLYCTSHQQNGLIRPSSNSLVLSIIENLIPTIFTTLLEPFWVLLNQFLCLLQPFDELRKGNSRSDKSLGVKYTSLPPQLVFWRALRARHFVLAAVCAIAVSTNILSVALSGLFNESAISVPVLTNSTYLYLPQINTSASLTADVNYALTYTDHFYVAYSNATANTSLPAWIDSKYFYLPFTLSDLPETSVDGKNSATKIQAYQAVTRGFGIVGNCKAFSTNDSINIDAGGSNSTIIISDTLADGNSLYCEQNIMQLGAFSYSNASRMALIWPFDANAELEPTSDTTNLCGSVVIAGWARLGPKVSNDSVDFDNTTEGRSFESSFLWCKPSLVTGEFNVTVDATGLVLASNQTSAFDDDVNKYFVSSNGSTIFFNQIANLIGFTTDRTGRWSSDSYTTDWMNALLAISLGNVSFLDPLSPITDIDVLLPRYESIFQQLTAILMGLNKNTNLFPPSNNNTIIPLAIMTTQTRIFMSDSMFVITITLLALHSLIAIIYYICRPRRFLPRMPSTIASIIAYVSASHALDDIMLEDKAGHIAQTYSYGRFVGVDGKAHVGIERHELVVPLEVKNPEVKRRIRWKKDPREVQTWI